MDVRKNALIILISLAIGGLITYWLYIKYHILFFVVFIPIIGFGGGLISRLFRQMRFPEREEGRYEPDDELRDFEKGFPGDDRAKRNDQKKFLPRRDYLPPGDSSGRDS